MKYLLCLFFILSIVPREGEGTTSLGEKAQNLGEKAQNYFVERKRPLRHFLDIGVGLSPIPSVSPFEVTTAFPVFLYVNYRRERWKKLKVPVIFSLKYETDFLIHEKHKAHVLAGVRFPRSHDLNRFHVDLLAGLSFPANFSFQEEKLAGEGQLLLTHIVGPRAGINRFYFQWGSSIKWQERVTFGLILHLGVDNHL